MNRSSLPAIRRILVSTLSPVHVGCGEDYEPTHFVIHDGLLHVLDTADLAAALSEGERHRLAAIVDEPEPIGALQAFFRDRAERFSLLARRQVAAAEAVCKDYEEKAGRPTQRGERRSTYNAFPIARTAFRAADGAPYLPGSSLKGSLRTAWLNRYMGGTQKRGEEFAADSARKMEQHLLEYKEGQFQDDPFRQLAIADAHPGDETPPPTQVLYAVSKKKRAPRAGERLPWELKVFLETVPAAMPAAFAGEIRFAAETWCWNELCDACNTFYGTQLRSEMAHAVLGPLLDPFWQGLMRKLLDNELAILMQARQGFLLRVGRHCGAESVTLDGVRRIKILGPTINGRQTWDERPQTTEKRFASLSKRADAPLLPFGWLWVDACDDSHRHLSDSLRAALAEYSRPLREAHADRLARSDDKRRAGLAAAAERRRAAQAQASAERAAAEAESERQQALAEMTPNRRRVEDFVADLARRYEQLRGQKENANGVYHGKARQLASEAAGWPLDDRIAVSEAIESWLPKVVKLDIKEEGKKLKLSALRGL